MGYAHPLLQFVHYEMATYRLYSTTVYSVQYYVSFHVLSSLLTTIWLLVNKIIRMSVLVRLTSNFIYRALSE